MANGKRRTGVHFGGGHSQKARTRRRKAAKWESKTPNLTWLVVAVILGFYGLVVLMSY